MKKETFKTIIYWKVEATTENNCKIFHTFKSEDEAKGFLLKHWNNIKTHQTKMITRTIVKLTW